MSFPINIWLALDIFLLADKYINWFAWLEWLKLIYVGTYTYL